MRRYYISDRRPLGGVDGLLECIRAHAGVEMVQIREKDLSGKDLYSLVRQAVQVVRGSGTAILVNERMDIALAAEAQGIHLPANSPDVRLFRSIAPAGFRIGISCHSVAEVTAATVQGADFAVFGPVFLTESKRMYGPPLGLPALRDAAAAAEGMPLFALGGITWENAAQCLQSGAAGIAGISIFQNDCGRQLR